MTNERRNDTQPEEFDLVVLGSGEGSKYLAWTLSKQGQRVAVVEQRWIGGSCPNIACLPSKNIIHSAKVASYFARAKEFGIETPGYTIHMEKVIDRKRAMVKGLVDIHRNNFKNSGVDLILGRGYFVGPKLIQVDLKEGGTRLLHGKKILIGTGTHAALEKVPGLEEAKPLTHIEALELDTVPGHLIVLGGGYIGLEFAQAMRRFGSRVSVLDRNTTLLHREDADISTGMESLLRDEGIDLLLGATVKQVAGISGQNVEITYQQGGETKTLQGTHLMVTIGRTPNTAGIGLELAGVELNARGYIKVNERLETTAEGVWANGEVAGSPQFTHIAFDDFRILRDNFSGGHRTTTGRQVPFSMFTDPEFARVGLSETEAKTKGIAYRLFKIPMAAVLRTRTLSEMRGFMKALVGEDDRILGFTIFGVDGGEIMSAVQIAMIGNLPYTALRDAILAHPTLMEGLTVLFSSAPTAVDPKSSKETLRKSR
ncbi:dihydrolipoyl dehydrogenase family protein [Silvibacterium sp.]|uniref:dihydrolipoyl dehydrogenase family protein n=1 Tax=Silvibacterium sp. TaxID=1964179 RepID=UPI0039E27020